MEGMSAGQSFSHLSGFFVAKQYMVLSKLSGFGCVLCVCECVSVYCICKVAFIVTVACTLYLHRRLRLVESQIK